VWYAGLAFIPHGHLHIVTYTRGRIDSIDSPDDAHSVARNMYRIGINKYKKKNCASIWPFTKTVVFNWMENIYMHINNLNCLLLILQT